MPPQAKALVWGATALNKWRKARKFNKLPQNPDYVVKLKDYQRFSGRFRPPPSMLRTTAKGTAWGAGGEVALNTDIFPGFEDLFKADVAHAPESPKAKSDKRFEKYIKSLSPKTDPKNAAGLLRSKILTGKKNK